MIDDFQFYKSYQSRKAWDYIFPLKKPLDFIIPFFDCREKSCICNKFVYKLEKRSLFSSRVARFIFLFVDLLFRYSKCVRIFGNDWFIGGEGFHSYRTRIVTRTFCLPPLFVLTKRENTKGEKELEKYFGCGKDKSVITFANRDRAYLASGVGGDLQRAAYHDYRNSTIANFVDAINLMSEKYFCFRMGKVAEVPLKIENDSIVDYPNSKFKSDFLETYIFAKAKFYIGDDSGINAIPCAFKKKLGITNAILFSVASCPISQGPLFMFVNNLSIFKRYFSIEKGKLFNLSEIILSFKNSGLSPYLGSSYEKLGIKLIENSPKEILDLTVELDKRVNDDWEEDPEHLRRENEFWKIFDISCKRQDRMFFPKLGYNFLKENDWLVQ
jgi:putative glycosyltransferase (TIGR04372 family)